jgi:hypothetical protein
LANSGTVTARMLSTEALDGDNTPRR